MLDALVTRLLDRNETLANPKALEAIKKEADGLIAKGTSDLSTVKEEDDVIAEAKESR